MRHSVVPPPVIGYASVAAAFVVGEPALGDLDAAYVVGATILTLGTIGLLLRSRIAWAFLVVVHVGDVIVSVGGHWFAWVLLVNALMVGLLLARSTRQYVGSERTVES